MSDSTPNVEYDYSKWIEVANMTDYITQYGSGASLTDLKLSDLYRYLQNPYSNIKDIQKSSKYLTNKNGIVKEVLRTFKSLPTLDYVLSWSVIDDEKKLKKYEKKVHDFLREIDLKSFVRDGLYEVGEMGTVVTCLRNKKYVQFLDLDDLRINKQRNGKWVVEYDLKTIDGYKQVSDKTAIIESLPKEVTLAKYNLFKNKGDDHRYVELKNCDVIPSDSHRNFPYGLPITIGSWGAILQKEMINRVERSVADRLIKQVLILSAGHLDSAGEKPVPKEVVQAYFKEVSKLMQKKEGINQRNNDGSGTGTIALPHFLKLETLKVDTEMFKKELYEKIENDIYSNLGISPLILWGGGTGGGNFSSAELNSQKFFRYIFTILEKFESLINNYLRQILPSTVTCEFVFSKTTLLDKDKHVNQLKELYMQTGVSKFWIEAVTGLPYENVIAQVKYERNILKTDEVLIPPANAYTQSGKDGQAGRPVEENPTNENTIKSKGTGGNKAPSPSDM